jgi:hypothetical protein
MGRNLEVSVDNSDLAYGILDGLAIRDLPTVYFALKEIGELPLIPDFAGSTSYKPVGPREVNIDRTRRRIKFIVTDYSGSRENPYGNSAVYKLDGSNGKVNLKKTQL